MSGNLHAKCSQCGRGFRSNNRTELLSKIRKHMWRDHRDWMRRKIKTGVRKAQKVRLGGTVESGMLSPSIVSPHWVGFGERALIEKATGKPYEQVRADVLDFFARQLMSGIVSGAGKGRKK